MRIFLYIAMSTVATIGAMELGEIVTSNVDLYPLVGNSLFVFILSLLTRHHKGYLRYVRMIVAMIAAVATAVAAALLGMLIHSFSKLLGSSLMSPLSLGFYPPGPDVPFEYGAIAWVFSMFGLIALGLAIGLALRSWLPRDVGQRASPD